MIKGTTETGFKYKLSKARLENYELIEVLADVDSNPLLLPKMVNLLLNKEQAIALKEHIRDKEGFVSTEKMFSEIMDIFRNKEETKN